MEENRERPIGIFDSGVGGLTVVKQILKELPNENIVYFGDTARVPYGTKSKETITHFAMQDVRFLLSFNVKIIVVACNSVSSNSIDILKRKFSLPVIGVIDAGAEAACSYTRNRRIGVIGTDATVESNAYQMKIEGKCSAKNIFARSCPLFVPLAEEGFTEGKIPGMIAEKYLTEIRKKQIDTLILGCTHYPLLATTIQNVMGEDVTLVDPGVEVAKRVKKYLTENELYNDSSYRGNSKFYLSDIPRHFEKVAENFLGGPIPSPVKVTIEDY
ncbi:MAG: glutamate racemase [Proteobacteria bacterium]|nr:glutamate racemase [Pseudomonadota bacterium]